MAYTGTEIFNMAVAVIDELSDTGAIVDSQIAEYKYRAPYLLDMWQKEKAAIGDLVAIEEYSVSDLDSLYKWTKFAIPAGLKSIKEVMFVDDDSQIGPIQYRRFGNEDIYIYFTQIGTARMLYVPIPIKITSLTQTLEIDEITSIGGSYYLAEHFAMADQNDALAQRCRDKYAELKLDSIQSPVNSTEVIDVYGI